jgi:hypothetical protein
METFLNVLFYSGYLAVLTGLVILAFRTYVTRWIESKIATQLQDSRHVHEKELQELKRKFDIELNRVAKILDKEFSILPEAWVRLQDAYSAVGYIVSLFHSYPDLDRFLPEQREEFIQKSRLNDSHKREVLNAPERNKAKTYQQIIFWYELGDAKTKLAEYSTFIRKNSIFLRKALKEKFLAIESLLGGAIIDREVGFGEEGIQLWRTAYKTVNDQITPLVKELDDLMQSALHKGE